MLACPNKNAYLCPVTDNNRIDMIIRYVDLSKLLILCMLITSCTCRNVAGNTESFAGGRYYDVLRDSLCAIASNAPGEVGIAVIVEGKDTITVNDIDVYPLMSVFKLHQSVALCHELDVRGCSMDTVLTINRADLNLNTWSPMLEEQVETYFSLSVRELMEYTLRKSDNNASNLMFDRLLSVAGTDSFIATLVPRDGFGIAVSEAEMQQDHSLSYANHSSPLSTALLLERLFNDSILSPSSQSFICSALQACSTGVDRISAPLAHERGVVIAHKTGSGYINGRGELIAHNDAAYITLPDGRHYSIVVFIKDFPGKEAEASELISRISALTYDFVVSPCPVVRRSL